MHTHSERVCYVTVLVSPLGHRPDVVAMLVRTLAVSAKHR